jgi:hypothetical protein
MVLNKATTNQQLPLLRAAINFNLSNKINNSNKTSNSQLLPRTTLLKHKDKIKVFKPFAIKCNCQN